MAGRNVSRLLRWVTAIAQVIERNAVGGRSIIRRNVGSIAAEVAVDDFGLGGDGGGEDREGESEFGQCFHGVEFFVEDRPAVSAAFAASFLFVHSNSLHSLHRKQRRLSYKIVLARQIRKMTLTEGRVF